MAMDLSHGASLRRRLPCHALTCQGLLGFAVGYLILHPASMLIFQCMDPRMSQRDPMADGRLAAVALSFRIVHVPMALTFGTMAALIAAGYGYHRSAIAYRRDCLAAELKRNEKLRAELAGQAERLRQQNRELARLELTNRRTTQFLVHDFKASLGCVGGFADMLLEKPALREDPDAADALVRIRRQAHHMLGSVWDLLQLARVREKGPPPTQRVSAATLLQNALRDFSLPAATNNISLGEHFQRCPDVAANPQLVHRVLCNLISNAIKHNRPHTRVWLDAHVDCSRRSVVFLCRDNGQGIPAQSLPTLFQEFATAGDASSVSTGLGLAFCRTAVEAQRGRIWCESSPAGTQFTFTIPLYKESSDERK